MTNRKEQSSFFSRLFNRLELIPGWSRACRLVDALYLYHHRIVNNRKPRTELVKKSDGGSISVLIICKGNICRSPFLEKYLRANHVGNNVLFASAGLRTQQSDAPPQEAIDIAAADFGIDLSGHRPKPLNTLDVEETDLIIGMEPIQHIEFCMRYFKSRKKLLLLRALEEMPDSLRLRDPYGENENAFRECYTQLARDAQILLANLRSYSEPRMHTNIKKS